MSEAFQKKKPFSWLMGREKKGGSGHASWRSRTWGLDCSLSSLPGEKKQNGHSRVCCGSGLIDGCLFFLFACGNENEGRGWVREVALAPFRTYLSGLVGGMCRDGRLGCCRL